MVAQVVESPNGTLRRLLKYDKTLLNADNIWTVFALDQLIKGSKMQIIN